MQSVETNILAKLIKSSGITEKKISTIESTLLKIYKQSSKSEKKENNTKSIKDILTISKQTKDDSVTNTVLGELLDSSSPVEEETNLKSDNMQDMSDYIKKSLMSVFNKKTLQEIITPAFLGIFKNPKTDNLSDTSRVSTNSDTSRLSTNSDTSRLSTNSDTSRLSNLSNSSRVSNLSDTSRVSTNSDTSRLSNLLNLSNSSRVSNLSDTSRVSTNSDTSRVSNLSDTSRVSTNSDSILSIKKTLTEFYKFEKETQQRENIIKKAKDQQEKKKEKEKNLLEDILQELRGKDKTKKKESIVDKLKKVFNILKDGLSGIGDFLGKSIKGVLTSKFFTSFLGPVFKSLFAVAGPIFGVVSAALLGWKLGEWLNKNWIEPVVKPALQTADDWVRGKIDDISGGGSSPTESGERVKSVDVTKLIEQKTNDMRGNPMWGIPAMEGPAKEQTEKDIEVLKEVLSSIKNRKWMNDQLAIIKEQSKLAKTEEERTSITTKSNNITENIKQEEGKINELIKSRPALDQELGVQKKQTGGHINVPGSGSGDKVPMMLPPGSFVMNRNAAAMLQSGGLVPTLLEPGEKVFAPGQYGPIHELMNSMIPRFQEGGVVNRKDTSKETTSTKGSLNNMTPYLQEGSMVSDTYGKHSEEGILPPQAKTTPNELKLVKILDKFSGKAEGGAVQPQKKGIYIEGGREGYAPHYHINRADQANFNRIALDNYVKVNGKPLSSGDTVSGGEYGASRDGGKRKHSGIDFAFGGGKELSLAGEAEWLSNKLVNGIGDKASFKTPVGVFEVIHGTYKGNALPGSYDSSNIAGTPSRGGSGGGGGGGTPGSGLIGSLGSMGKVGEVIGSFLQSISGTLGENSWLINSIFGSPAMAASTDTGPGGSGNGSGGGEGGMVGGGKDGAYDIAMRIGADKKKWDIFRNTIAKIESGGKYNIPGGSGKHYDGRYQLGAAAKTDAARILGVKDPGHGEAARKAFRENAEMQEKFFAAYTVANHGYMIGNPKFKSADVPRRLQMLGYAHNQGGGGANTWLNSGVVGADGFGTKGTKYTEALAANFKAAGYQTGGVVNMSATQSPNASRFKKAQEEFAETIAKNVGGGNQVIVVNGGGAKAPSPAISQTTSSKIPSLPSGPSTIQAAEYFYRLNMGSVF